MEKQLIIEELRKWEGKGFYLSEGYTWVELIGKNSRLGIEFEDEPSWWIARIDGYANFGEDINLETIKVQLELL